MNGRDVILAGIPRGGTTLAVRLLNDLPDAVALHEPMKPSSIPSAADACDAVAAFFEGQRASLRANGTALSKRVRGLPYAAFEEQPAAGRAIERGSLVVQKQLPDDFYLCVKHGAAFTALLPQLTKRFSCYAIVRNPLAVLGSWGSTSWLKNYPKGRAPAAERLDPALKQRLNAAGGKRRRQVALLDWFFRTCLDNLPRSAILRYEDVVTTGGAALAVVVPGAAGLRYPLESRNANEHYDWLALRKSAELLLDSDGAYWDLYAKEDVEELLRARA